jgi:septin family protein
MFALDCLYVPCTPRLVQAIVLAAHFLIAMQETPGLGGDGRAVAALTDYISARQAAFAAQEHDVGMTRGAVDDGRVDAVLYFLPTNARVAELDLSAMRAFAKLVPVVPVMAKVGCSCCLP